MSGSTHLLLQVTGLMRGWVTRRPCLKNGEEEKKTKQSLTDTFPMF